MTSIVGFYWTLPVNWADFRSIPDDVELAAQSSKTIRYQMERVRHWAAESACRLVHEIAYIDTRTDRATDGCKASLDRARQRCADKKALLTYVNFGLAHFWRRNRYIHDHAEALGFEPCGLAPIPVAIDGKLFDPIKHFEAWRERDRAIKASLHERADEGLLKAYLECGDGPGRYDRMAKWLKANGVKTATGKKEWSAENVRKAVKSKLSPNASNEDEQVKPALPGIFD